ncbi:MAG: DNA internalization-related competence protein ComEC/Rec2 [Deltaproteobacteria bacterium RBG_16_54_18]|nr:MAG: DNA internalization-related competence protein ComEC/Rec2 [Deltaproteobacteria bacterium RBG_16_54_18]
MIAAGWKPFRSPFLPLTLTLIAGILLGELIPPIVSLYAIGLLLCVCILLWRRRLFLTQLLALALVLAAGSFLIQRAINPAIPPNHVSLIPDREKATLTGTILLPPQREEKETVFYLQTEEVSLGNTTASGTGRVRITIRDPAIPLQYGYRVRLLVKLYHPRNFKNPGSFDYAGYLRRQGVLVTGYVRDSAQVQILSREGGNPLLRWFDRRRQEIAVFLDATTSLPGKGFLKAVLIGERGDISQEVNDAFVATGTVHILSISGSHLSIIVTLIFFSVQGLLALSERCLLRYDTRKVAAWATFPPMLAYLLITGLPIATIRAGIMASCFLVAILLDRYRNPVNTLALAAFIILVCSPASLWDISFQLSFLSVLGIIVITPPVYRLFYPRDPLSLLTHQREGKIKRAITISLIASFAAIAVTSPVVAFHFHRFSAIGMLANAIIIPLVGFGTLPLGLFSLPLIPLFPAAAALMVKAAAVLSAWGIKAVELLASLPFASSYLPGPTALEMIIFYAFIATLLWLKRPAIKKIALVALVCVALLDLSYWGFKRYSMTDMRVTFLDVGQGDCALVEFPRGKTMLIDGGGLYGDFDVGEKVIAPFLWKRRILQVDYLLLSHPQPDHYKGLIFITRHFRPREFWHNGMTSPSSTYGQLMEAIKESRTREVRVEGGFTRSIEGVTMKIIHPVEGWMGEKILKRGLVNNNAVVMMLAFGDHRLLFTGDIEKKAETRLAQAGKRISAQVIKVPHHGSKQSSTETFLNKVSPRYAVISVGFANPYHLPNKEVVERYARRNCLILRTDLDGAITVQSDGKKLTIGTYEEL